VYRSHQGCNEPWDLTTLCAWHHQRGEHGKGLKVRGRAPDDLVLELPIGRFLSGDRKVAISTP
jgi:GTPase involved in cell partitioning and DNA repair